MRNFGNSTGPTSTTPLLHQLSSSSISNRKCRCVQHRHPERPTRVEGSVSSLSSTLPALSPSNRKSGIRNPHNRCVFNRFHFSNRKYLAISYHESASHSPLITRHCPSNRDTAIKNPDKPRLFSRFQFSNRDKMRVLHPEISELASLPASPLRHFPASHCPKLCVSVPPWPIFAIMAGSN